MELPEIVEIGRNFAVMVKIQGPDPKALKMRRHAFHHYESGKTTLSASGLLLPDSFNDAPVVKQLLSHDRQDPSVLSLVVTSASLVEPFLSKQHRENHMQGLPKLVPGAHIDVLAENKVGDKLAEADNRTSCWFPSQLLALVDVPASSLALQSLLEAHRGSPENGSWVVGWSLASLNSNSQFPMDTLKAEVESDGSSLESQRRPALDESSNPNLMAMSTTRIAFLGISTKKLKDLPSIDISPPNKRGDLLLVIGSPFGILSPLHFFNSISVGAISNCCPPGPGSSESSLLMSDVRCLPGMEGCPVFGEHAHLIGILTRPLRQRAGGAEIQLVVTWDAIATACCYGLQKDLKGAKGGLHDMKAHLSGSKDSNGAISYAPAECSPLPHFEKAMASIVLVTTIDGTWASGIVLNNHGLILTNAHLLEPWRFGKTPLLTGRSKTSTPTSTILLKRPMRQWKEGNDGQEEKNNSLLPLMNISNSSMLDSFYKSHSNIRVRLEHMEQRIWCDAKAVYVSKGPLDVALLQLESVPNQLCPIVPNFVCPSPGSKVHVIGHGLFGPRSGLCPSVCSGVVARVVKTQKPPHLYESGVLNTEERNIPAMLETTAAVHPGGSGGAVVNADGNMIGLVTSNARHGGGTVIPHLNFSIPCAALEPIFQFSRDTKDLSILQALDRPNELLSSVWALMPPLSPRPSPAFPYLSQSQLEKNNEGKGSRFAKFLAEKHTEVSLRGPTQKQGQLVKEGKFSNEILVSKL